MSDYIAATTHVDAVNHKLIFDSEGYYVVGDGEWQDITFTTVMTYNGGNIGIAPRIYDTNFYMFLTIHNENADDTGTTQIGFASLDAQVTYNTYNIAQARIAPLVVGQEYTFKTEITGVYYKISLNDTVIFNVPYPGMSKGSVGVYATAGNSCKSIEVQSLFADGWTSNADTVPGSIINIRELPNEDKYVHIVSPNDSSVYVQQLRTVTAGGTYTMSFNYKGSGKARIIESNGAAPQTYTYVLISEADWVSESWTQKLSADCTSAYIYLYVNNEELMANSIQLEEKAVSTGYIHNDSLTSAATRENSIITYPSKDNINSDLGSISMWVKPSMDYTATTGYITTLFEYGEANPILIYYNASGYVRFKYGSTYSVGIKKDLLKDNWYHISVSWNEDKIQLWVDGVMTELNQSFGLPDTSDIIRIGWSSNPTYRLFYGAIDETIVYSSVLTQEEVDTIRTSSDGVVNSGSMIMRASFNHAIANFNKSIIETTLIPNYGSPVLIEKGNGTAMRKVSFFDFITGEYRTFNEEVIQYDKKYDYIELSYYDKDIDQETFKINVVDEDEITHGQFYTLEGKKLHLNLTDGEKETLDGKYLYVTYQLEDSYTVDFNINVPDSFRVTLGKHDGQPVKITYEGNRFTDEKLTTMVEMNPLLNPNHEGFLYITHNDEKVSAFRAMATPSDIPANGGSESLIVVEPLDINGNFISHCKLQVSCELGTIIPTYDEQSIKIRERAGRFLYRYNAPIKFFDDVRAYELVDYVNVVDEETGIGVQIPITLTTLREEEHTIGNTDTLESIAEKYGATISDIAYANENKSLSVMRTWVIANRGLSIQIPVNYSKKELEKSQLEVKHDAMMAYLTNLVIDYMNKPVTKLPSGLGALLDFNEDGMINIDEITWLNENKLTTVLEQKHIAVLAWDAAN